MPFFRLKFTGFSPLFNRVSLSRLWPALLVLSLWPVWLWSARRFLDGSDDPLGVLALLALFFSVWRARHQLTHPLRLRWVLVSLVFAVFISLIGSSVPLLLKGIFAVMAVFAAIMAVRSPDQPVLAWAVLGFLSLPLMASLQFFAGYPLRVVTAEVSAWLLRAADMSVIRQGSALLVDHQLIMVDAPCSGVQMGWVAYFTATLAALWTGLSDKRFACRLPFIGSIVIIGNIVRNTLLVIRESGKVNLPDWSHQGIGLVVFALVCVAVLWVVTFRQEPPRQQAATVSVESRNMKMGRIAKSPKSILFLIFVLPLLMFIYPLISKESQAETQDSQTHVEWPHEYEGRALRPLALSLVEARFAADFPGVIARFDNGIQAVTLRHVTRPTRKLHPAADCFRALGYAIDETGLEQQIKGNQRYLQRCFTASKAAGKLKVCEYIEDINGERFTDTSAWYWAAVMGKSHGPWKSVTLARPI